MAKRKKPTDRNRIVIETPGVIDPTDPHAQRRFQIQQRGGLYSDRVRIDPFSRDYGGRSRRRGTRRA
jgi:hypothetical protein